MPKVHFVKRARKDNPAVKAGESYYWWKNRHGPKRYSVEYPRPSQLVSSSKLAEYLATQEEVEDYFSQLNRHVSEWADVADAQATLEMASNALHDTADEYRDGAAAQEEYFGETDQVTESYEKAAALDEIADQLQAAADALGQLDEQQECEDCGGIGSCTTCNGEGQDACSWCGGAGEEEDGPCPYCDDGFTQAGTCAHCGGNGVVMTTCGHCAGDGYFSCDNCDGSGECEYCQGAGTTDWDYDTLLDEVGQAYEDNVDWNAFYWA